MRPTPPPTEPDVPRQVATEEPMMPQYVAPLEREVEQLHDDREFLREQIKVSRDAFGSAAQPDQSAATPSISPKAT